MKKLIAILTALTMLFGAVCAFAEDDAEDILDELGEELEEELEEVAEELEDAADELEDVLDDDADPDDWGEETDEDEDEDEDDPDEYADDDEDFGLMGGWTVAQDPTITPELKAVFDKGMEGLIGVNYVPVLYLGSQVVAGTNHAFLCQATVVVPDAQPEWMVVYLYQDLQGEISVLDIGGFDVGAFCDYGSDEDE